jgi:hypothetical protein
MVLLYLSWLIQAAGDPRRQEASGHPIPPIFGQSFLSNYEIPAELCRDAKILHIDNVL